MPNQYNPRDHYWVRQNDIYSSRKNGFVDLSDADYLGWVDAGNLPTICPDDIADVVSRYGIIFPESLLDSIRRLLTQIDADVDRIYGAVLGNRAAEYALAESEAIAYKAASYAAPAPPSVQVWAAAKNQTAQWAADDILATAANWRAAQIAIRSARLGCKEAARAATDATALHAVGTQWAGFVTQIMGQLSL